MGTRIAKYEEIKRHIREKIRAGELHEGDRVPSEYALVDQLGVGRSQARQALRELEIEGYLIRRQGSGSFVAPHAGRGAGQVAEAPRTVAVAFPTYNSAYMRSVVEGFMEGCFAGGCGVTNYNVRLDEEEEVRFLESMPDSGVAGLMIWLGNETDKVRESLLRLSRQRFPVIMVDRYFPNVDCDFVVSDNDEIGYQLVRALIERGCRRIGLAHNDLDMSTSQANRIRGYERALQEAGLSADPAHRIRVDFPGPSLDAAVNAAMAGRNRPDAFMCVNDIIADHLARQLQRLGYELHRDITLALVDDGTSMPDPGLSALKVRQNGMEIGRRAAELMVSRLSNFDRPAQHVVVPPWEVTEAVTPAPAVAATGKEAPDIHFSP